MRGGKLFSGILSMWPLGDICEVSEKSQRRCKILSGLLSGVYTHRHCTAV